MDTTKKSPYEAIIKPDKSKGQRSMFYYIHIWMFFTIIVCVFILTYVSLRIVRVS